MPYPHLGPLGPMTLGALLRPSITIVTYLLPTSCKWLLGGQIVCLPPDISKKYRPPGKVSNGSALWSLLVTGCIHSLHSRSTKCYHSTLNSPPSSTEYYIYFFRFPDWLSCFILSLKSHRAQQEICIPRTNSSFGGNYLLVTVLHIEQTHSLT